MTLLCTDSRTLSLLYPLGASHAQSQQEELAKQHGAEAGEARRQLAEAHRMLRERTFQLEVANRALQLLQNGCGAVVRIAVVSAFQLSLS